MTLPTPPRSSHSSSKENISPATRAVAWAVHNQIHNLSSPPAKLFRTPSSISRDQPARSILKKQSFTSLPLPGDICDDYKPREVTPEPADPLCNLTYLEHPVSRIVAFGAPLKDVIEAYNVLAARLRSSVTDRTDADASWPLFQPLRKNRNAFVNAVIRDLGRALVDPLAGDGCHQSRGEGRILAPLPSPNNTPKKKRDGMTAEQVKHARDLCTVSHSAIRLLSVVWTLPAIYGIFSDEELGEILTQLLAIPLAPELPTINARKTCALSIWLIQTQRLPRDVLAPAADRIAAALARAIDGELGKEGKKGSVSDGLKAIHDLCVYQPGTFVKAFAPILQYVLQNLLAPTPSLRVQACQALGGMVTGANRSINRKGHVHARFSRLVRLFLTRVPAKKKEQSSTQGIVAPSTPREPLIIRTLRLTLEATDPQHTVQGPVWALNVLASLIVLLGPVLVEDHALRRLLTSLLTLGLRHPKSSVRALACIVWRPLIWAWFQPAFSFDFLWEHVLEDIAGEGNRTAEEKELRKSERKEAREKEIMAGRNSLWKVLTSVVECQTGVVMIAALLGASKANDDSEDDRLLDPDDSIRRMFSVLKVMVTKGGATCQDGVEVLKRLVSADKLSERWYANMLLPRSLFSATSNLLSVEFKNLSTSVRSILQRSAGLEEIRSLTSEELSKEWIFDGLIEVWREIINCLEIMDGDDSPVTDISEPWDGLIKVNVDHLLESGNDAATIAFTVRAANILIDIIQDRNIDMTPKASVPPSVKAGSKAEIEVLSVTLSSDPPHEDPVPTKRSTNGELKLKVVRDLWRTVRTMVPHSLLATASEKFLLCLVTNEDELVDEDDLPDLDAEHNSAALKSWAQLCAELVISCDIDVLKAFWGFDSNASLELGRWRRAKNAIFVWRVFANMWKTELSCAWENCAVLLSVPFMDIDTEGPCDDDNTMWESLLDIASAKALDHGLDTATVLEQVAGSLARAHDWDAASTPSFVRASDALLSRLDPDELREVPSALLGLVNDVLSATYPPSPQVKQYARWLLRSLSDLVRKCEDKDMASVIVAAVKQSVGMWILDEAESMNEEEWSYDMEPLYGYVLSIFSFLPKTIETVTEHLPILGSALLGDRFRTSLAADAFKEFWTAYSDVVEPREGWPAGLVRCLTCAGQPREGPSADRTEEDSVKTPERAFALLPSSSSTLFDDASNESGLNDSTLSPPSTPTQRDKLLFSDPTTPSSSIVLLSPPRVKCSSPIFRASLLKPSLPSPTWIAVRNKTTGSRKRMRISTEDKENNSPPVTSPSQRLVTSISDAKTIRQHPTTPTKRKIQSDLDVGHPSPSKKSRSDTVFSHSTNVASSTSDTEDEYCIASRLLKSPTSSDEVVPSSVGPRKRKRMTMILEAVEVPSVKSVTMKYRQSAREMRKNSSMDKGDAHRQSGPSKSKLRRAKSDSSREPSREKRRLSFKSDQEDLFGPLPLPSLFASCKTSATTPLSGTSHRADPASASAMRAFKLDLSSASLGLSPPPSPSPQVRLLPASFSDNSEIDDDASEEGSSPLKSAKQRRIRRTRSQTIDVRKTIVA